LISDDFPTLDLPRNKTLGPVKRGSSSGRYAEHSNRQDVIFNERILRVREEVAARFWTPMHPVRPCYSSSK
jgi:hypothetical protein